MMSPKCSIVESDGGIDVDGASHTLSATAAIFSGVPLFLAFHALVYSFLPNPYLNLLWIGKQLLDHWKYVKMDENPSNLETCHSSLRLIQPTEFCFNHV